MGFINPTSVFSSNPMIHLGWWSLSSEVGSYRSTNKRGRDEEMPFKYLLAFAKVKPGLSIEEALDKQKEIAEKSGLKIVFQGIPTGMRDQVVIAFKVDEGIDKFYSKMFELPRIFTDGRTHAVFVPWSWEKESGIVEPAEVAYKISPFFSHNYLLLNVEVDGENARLMSDFCIVSEFL